MRTFVIINTHNKVDICENILSKIPTTSKVIVYTNESIINNEKSEKIKNFRTDLSVDINYYEEAIKNDMSKLRNIISKSLLDNNIKGFVHLLEDSVQIFNEPSNFLVEIEKMMTILKLKTWFNTSCDMCNFVYSKYNPRLFIVIDEEMSKKKYDKTIAWCSNANTVWSCYNMELITFEDVRFEEKFKFSMYYIIEFLARRRNNKKNGQLDYMNFYPSINEELDVFRCIDTEQDRLNQEKIDTENKMFIEMNINTKPDFSIEKLMEDMFNILNN